MDAESRIIIVLKVELRALARQLFLQLPTPKNSTMKRYLLFLPALLLTLLTGCLREDSENVNQDRIWAHYEMFYDANEDITYARATFRFGHAAGTKLDLTEPSEVRFNGDPIPFREGLAYYEEDYAGFVDAGTFEFQDLNDNIYINDVSINTIEFPADFGPIDQNASFDLIWDGDPLQNHEAVSVWLNGINEGDAQLFLEGSEGAAGILLGMDNLQELPVGTTSAVIERTYAPPIQEGTEVGGLINGRYRGTSVDVEIE